MSEGSVNVHSALDDIDRQIQQASPILSDYYCTGVSVSWNCKGREEEGSEVQSLRVRTICS